MLANVFEQVEEVVNDVDDDLFSDVLSVAVDNDPSSPPDVTNTTTPSSSSSSSTSTSSSSSFSSASVAVSEVAENTTDSRKRKRKVPAVFVEGFFWHNNSSHKLKDGSRCCYYYCFFKHTGKASCNASLKIISHPDEKKTNVMKGTHACHELVHQKQEYSTPINHDLSKRVKELVKHN